MADEKKSKLQLKVVLGFSVALILVAIAAMINFTSLNRLLSSVKIISEPDHKLICLKQLVTNLADQESYVRTYTLNHDERFLSAYHQISDSLEYGISELKTLTADNSKQSAMVDSIDWLIGVRVHLFNGFIEGRSKELAKQLKVTPAEIPPEKIIPDPAPQQVIAAPVDTIEKSKNSGGFLKNIFRSKKDKKNSNKDNESTVAVAMVDSSVNNSSAELNSQPQISIVDMNAILAKEQARISKQVEGWSLEELVLLQEDKMLMDKIRSSIKILEKDEEVIANQQIADASDVAKRATTIITIISVLGTLSILLFIYLILRDISNSQRLRKQLIEERKRAEKLAKVKEEFLANMSHEIRTPLNSIMGFAEQLSRHETDEKQRSFVHAIQHSADHLVSLVNQILSFSKTEAGKMKKENTPFDLYRLIREVFETFNIKAAEKNCLFSYTIEENVPRFVAGDPLITKQILINLVGNAVKFTEQGSVDILCKESDEKFKEDLVGVTIVVKDTGIGIAPEMQEKIFEEFTQGESETTRKYGGTGLGLAITKKLTALLQGHIEVSSAPGQGSVFTVTIPFTKTEVPLIDQEEKKAEIQSSSLRNKSVLLVDDEEMNVLLGQTILENWGMKVEIARGGKEALEKLNARAAEVTSVEEDKGSKVVYDLILLDIQMPEMSGTEVATIIRASTDESIRHIPIIALTANVFNEQLKNAHEAVINEVLIKPFRERELFDMIQQVIGIKSEDTSVDGIDFDEEEAIAETEPELFTLKYLEKTSGANRDFEIKMLQLFIQNNTHHLERLRNALAESDWETIHRIAHKMIPQFRYLQIRKTESSLKLMEQLTEERKHLEKIPELLEEISSVTDQVINSLHDEIKKLQDSNGVREEPAHVIANDHY